MREGQLWPRPMLSQLATGAGLRVVTGVSSIVSFLCAGANAGPVKLEHAHDYGIPIMSRAQFLHFLDTGEIPMTGSASLCVLAETTS